MTPTFFRRLAAHLVCTFLAAAPLVTQAAAPSATYLLPNPSSTSTSQNGSVSFLSSDGMVFFGRNNGTLIKGSVGAALNTATAQPAHTIRDISANGSVTVGSTSGRATRAVGNTVTTIGPTGDTNTSEKVSADGSVVAGRVFSPETKIFRWTSGTGFVTLPLPLDTRVNDVLMSRDGSVIATMASRAIAVNSYPTTEAVFLRWDAAGTLTELLPPQGYHFSGGISVADNGTIVLLIMRPNGALAILRLEGANQTIITPPQRFETPEYWESIAISADASTIALSSTSSSRSVLYKNGTFTQIPNMFASSLNADGTLIFGQVPIGDSSARHPGIWHASTGPVDLVNSLASQLPAVSFPSGSWSAIRFAQRGDTIVFGGTSSRMSRRALLGELTLSSLTAPNPFAGTLLDDLPAKKSLATYTENIRVTTSRYYEPPFDEEPGYWVYEPVSTEAARWKFTLPLEAIDPSAFSATSPVEFYLGTTKIFSGQMGGGDGPFDASAKKLSFLSGQLKVNWATKVLTVDFASSSILGRLVTSNTGSTQSAIQARLRLGDHTGSRWINIKATAAFRDFGEEGFQVGSYKATGAFAPSPTLTVKLDKDGAAFSNAHLPARGSISNPAGALVFMRVNGGEWIALGRSTALALPSILLAPGANTIELKARNASGVESAIFSRTFHFLPKTGTYPVVLHTPDGPAGYATVVLNETGALTGKLNIGGKKYPLRGTLDGSGNGTAEILRPGGLAPITVVFALTTTLEKNTLAVTATIPAAEGAPVVATGSGGRATAIPLQTNGYPTYLYILLKPGVDAHPALKGIGHLYVELTPKQEFRGWGKLADGTRVTIATPVTDAFVLPLFLPLAKTKGLLAGELQIDPTEVESDISGVLRWTRGSSARGPFATGWDFDLSALGSTSSGYDSVVDLHLSGAGLPALLRLKGIYPWMLKATFKDQTGARRTAEFAVNWKSRELGGFFLTPEGSGLVTGVDSSGTSDGDSVTARFRNLRDIAVDPAGNVYVLDADGTTLRKITPAGQVTTLAGKPFITVPPRIGTGSDARLRGRKLAVDTSGNVYLIEDESYAIRKVTPGGTVSLFSGSLTLSGSENGTPDVARYYYPQGITFAANHLYLPESPNQRKVTLAGDATSVDFQFLYYATDGTYAERVIPAPDGTIYALRRSYRGGADIVKVEGTVLTRIAGNAAPGSVDGTGSAARIGYVDGFCVDGSGNVYFTEGLIVRKATPQGVVTTIAGKKNKPGFIDGPGATARFGYLAGIAAHPAGGIVVADTQNFAIRRIAEDGTVTTIAGGRE